LLLGKRVIIVPSKRVVFVIVEGPTDEDALGVLFEKYFDKNTVRVKATPHNPQELSGRCLKE